MFFDFNQQILVRGKTVFANVLMGMLFGKKSSAFHGSSGLGYSKSRKNQSKHKKPYRRFYIIFLIKRSLWVWLWVSELNIPDWSIRSILTVPEAWMMWWFSNSKPT